MAGSGGLRVGITEKGFDAAKAQLESLGRKVAPVLRGALDSTVMDVRKRRYTPHIAKMFKGSSWVNKRITVKRVNMRKGRFDARLIASGSGVPVTEYKKWGYQAITATRARILVGSFKGHKVAAGFVNPASFARRPLASQRSVTRSVKKRGGQFTYNYDKGTMISAMGPSVAYYFKRLTSVTTIKYASQKAQSEFARRLRKELLKGNAK